MRTIIISESKGGWGYLILVDGVLRYDDPGPYDCPEDAMHDAIACPTPK